MSYDIKIRKPQLELGDKATDWSPNPSDAREEFVTQLQEINSKITTSIQQTEESILNTVKDTYYSKDTGEELGRKVSTLEQNSEGFKATVEKDYVRAEDINGEEGKVDKKEFQKLKNWLTYDDNQLTLGQEGSKTKLNLKNDKIQFLENGTTISEWGNDAFNADNGFFDVSLQIGNFSFTPRKNGSLSFGKVGK